MITIPLSVSKAKAATRSSTSIKYRNTRTPDDHFLSFSSLSEGQVSVLASALVLRLADLELWQPRLPVLAEFDPALGQVQVLPLHHLDALDDRADGVAEGAPGASVVLHLHKRRKTNLIGCWKIVLT